jgi:hypothetical protein
MMSRAALAAALRRRPLIDSTTIPFRRSRITWCLSPTSSRSYRCLVSYATRSIESSRPHAHVAREALALFDSLRRNDRQARGHAARGGHQHYPTRAISAANAESCGQAIARSLSASHSRKHYVQLDRPPPARVMPVTTN